MFETAVVVVVVIVVDHLDFYEFFECVNVVEIQKKQCSQYSKRNLFSEYVREYTCFFFSIQVKIDTVSLFSLFSYMSE